mmetsp:Transcript_8911/g.20447  ORF Transcript_8911/g.20447 Transcript_8911/m.20447 type:complete len:205 (+) Transcript_8911:3071-3685(+)
MTQMYVGCSIRSESRHCSPPSGQSVKSRYGFCTKKSTHPSTDTNPWPTSHVQWPAPSLHSWKSERDLCVVRSCSSSSAVETSSSRSSSSSSPCRAKVLWARNLTRPKWPTVSRRRMGIVVVMYFIWYTTTTMMRGIDMNKAVVATLNRSKRRSWRASGESSSASFTSTTLLFSNIETAGALVGGGLIAFGSNAIPTEDATFSFG